MRVPILSMDSPAQQLWLTDDPPQGARGKPVLIDASGQVHPPTAAPGVIIFKVGVCRPDFYYAAKATGYQVVWFD
jgi:hypothetical protein